MAKASLFDTPSALLGGYCDTTKPFHLDNNLSKGKGGRRVYLLGRVLKSGNISLMRYACQNGKRVRETLNVVLKLETDYNMKRENEEKVRLQVLACNQLNDDLERTEAGFTPRTKSKVRLYDYIYKVGEDSWKETGNKRSVYANMNSLAKHIDVFAGQDVTLGEVDEAFVRRFVSYLKTEALNLNMMRTMDEKRRREVKIAQNTQNKLIRCLNFVLNKARKAKFIANNPMDLLEKEDKVPAKAGTREYLTDEEVEILMQTPYTHSNYDIKEAFLFSCYTGLRWSDVKNLKMSDFRLDKKNGRYLKIRMVKTQEPLKIFIPDVAFDLLPDVEDDEQPIFTLPKNEYVNITLRRWIKDAGIKKRISFHCARHSAATILYSAGVPIGVIQKQLGHLKSQTTEIYAKMMDEAQSEASRTMDERFGRKKGGEPC